MEVEEDDMQSKQMKAENPIDFVTTKATSWRVIGGSLHDAVTCESSLSAVDSDSDSVGVCRRRPLVLRRPLPDSRPCEIKITFEQQYEIKQVYVKSTARVYEIYYAANPQSINEYLCSVRCGMAAKSNDPLEVLQESDGSRTESVSSGGSTKHLDEGVMKIDNGSGTNEDGWVEVKDLKATGLENGDISLTGNTEAVMQRDDQEFYEATAEISDGKPCTSVSLRLLSIQSGESVYINEVYIFADPVLSEDEDSSSTPSKMKNSSGDSLMSMLVPTLLQISRSRMSQLPERSDAGPTERTPYIPFSSYSTSNEIQKDTFADSADGERRFSKKFDTGSVQSTKVEVPSQPSRREGIPRSSCGINQSVNHIERMLEQLFLRVVKIEEFCSRFEEKMLNPIVCMEKRLEKVEEHLEVISKNSGFTLGGSSTRISAPDFCCTSELNSLSNDCKDYSGCKASESFCGCKASELSREVDCPAEEVTVPVSDSPTTVSACHLVPSLVVTAPDFSYADDEEEHDVVETVPGRIQDVPRRPMSINDALASALAGFLSSALPENQTSAPLHDDSISSADLSRDRISGDKEAALSSKCDVTVGPSSDSSNTSKRDDKALPDIFKLEQHPEDHQVCDVENQLNEVEIGPDDLEDTGNSVGLTENGHNDVLGNVEEASVNEGDSTSGKDSQEKGLGLLHGILGLPTPAAIDFRVPILEVNFASQEDPELKSSSLEVLLADGAESGVNLDEDSVAEISYKDDLVEVQDSRSVVPEANGHLLVEVDDDRSGNLSLSIDGALPELIECSDQTMSVGLLKEV